MNQATKEKQSTDNRGYFKVIKKSSTPTFTFHWDGKQLILPHWNFSSVRWEVPRVYIEIGAYRISFEPAEDFDLEYFLDAFQLFQVSDVYQKNQMRLRVELRDQLEMG